MLSDNEIVKQMGMKNIIIDPFKTENLNPNSYNLTLDDELWEYKDLPLDMKKEPQIVKHKIPPNGYWLGAGRLYLAKTVEYTETHGFVPCIDGRSSIGRLGLFIHVTAGFGDNGFKGCWTLEIVPAVPIKIYPFIKIAQIRYDKIDGRVTTKYEGKYQGNREIQKSMLYKELNKDGHSGAFF